MKLFSNRESEVGQLQFENMLQVEAKCNKDRVFELKRDKNCASNVPKDFG